LHALPAKRLDWTAISHMAHNAADSPGEAFMVLSVARTVLRKLGRIPPFAIIQTGDGSLKCVDLPPDKEWWKLYLTIILSREKAQRYYLVAQGWACKIPVADGASPYEPVPVQSILENPQRYEIIFVAAVERAGNSAVIEQRFVRDPKGIRLFKPVAWEDGAQMNTLPSNWPVYTQSGEAERT